MLRYLQLEGLEPKTNSTKSEGFEFLKNVIQDSTSIQNFGGRVLVLLVHNLSYIISASLTILHFISYFTSGSRCA